MGVDVQVEVPKLVGTACRFEAPCLEGAEGSFSRFPAANCTVPTLNVTVLPLI